MRTIIAAFILLTLSNISRANVEEYIEPRIEGLRVDICLTWGANCHKPAADQWCRDKSYEKAVYWEISENIGREQPTKMLHSKKICNKEFCDAFKTIVCYSESQF